MQRLNLLRLWREFHDVAEFQSALVRLAIWLFAAGYVGLSSFSEHHHVYMQYYMALFSTYLVIFLGIFISVLKRNEWDARRYFSLIVDCTATSFAIFLTGSPYSPFFILYLWIFISYGTRYGSKHLFAASAASMILYLIVCIALHAWKDYAFEVFFILLSLFFLPLYQYTLLGKLHQARREAEASSEAKASFLANMSHEIRTPMNGLMTMGELLRRTTLDEVQREYVDHMLSSGRALNEVLNDILDYSKIEAGVLVINPGVFALRELTSDVILLIQHSAQEKQLQLECNVEGDVPSWLEGDEGRIRQVLINLLGNAVRFTKQGKVTLRIGVHRHYENGMHMLRYSVSDTGIGIRPEDRRKLFQRFSQVDNSLSRLHGGSGLGLVISKRLVEAMGGEIGVQSEFGKGSTG